MLLVEDDPVATQALQAFLRAGPTKGADLRVAITTASTLQEALGELAAERFDAVLLDLTLPDSEGADTYRAIIAAAGDAAVVVLTGHQDELLALDALLAGAQDYLIKGEVGRNALLRALRHAVQRKAAMRAATTSSGGAVDPELRRHLDLLEAEHTLLRRIVAAPTQREEPPRLEPGALVAGRYRLVEALGRGATSVTFRAEDEVLRRPRVLKAFLGRDGGEDAARAFLQEARSAAGVEHPRVVGIRDFGLAGSVPYIVMDLVTGKTLQETLTQEGALPPERAARVMAEVLEGLAEIHRAGILHRDIKPSNVMIGETGAIIIDFGLATRIADPTASALAPAAAPEGTLGYMSPEALEGMPLSPASDVYAAGAMLFEMLAGRSYLRGGRRADVERAVLEEAPRLPDAAHPGLGAVALRALAKDPRDRFASAQQMREAILALGLT
ncbi:MAG TPA: protein kinase [Candidatus Thermoplasmatota archaeon]|nr:protein kinase [Candidatus Thermoplasmatota archaeon]